MSLLVVRLLHFLQINILKQRQLRFVKIVRSLFVASGKHFKQPADSILEVGVGLQHFLKRLCLLAPVTHRLELFKAFVGL